MKKLLLILLCLPMIGFGQQTYVPDDNFEQALINQGYDTVLDDSVLTANIDTITFMSLNNQNINNLIGVEDFIALEFLSCESNQLDSLILDNCINLTDLRCSGNNLTTLDVSSNLNLIELSCVQNQLTTLDVSANTVLEKLICRDNPLTILTLNDTSLLLLSCINTYLTTIDLSNNINLETAFINYSNLSSIDLNGATNLRLLSITDNQLTSLDISTNINLEILNAVNNDLSYLDLRNGNKDNLFINIMQNSDLHCISVDDTALANINWTVNNSIDSQHYFSLDCNATAVNETSQQTKHLLKIVDILGKDSKPNKKGLLFYIYSDGTVEKKIIVQ